MSVDQHETSGGQPLTPEQFLASFEATRECFHLTDGTLGSRGQTEAVEIAAYHAPMPDFLDIDKHRQHAIASDASPKIWIPLEVGPDFKYSFDSGDPWFRIGRGAFLHTSGRRIPVRLVTIDYEQFSDTWLYRDDRDTE